MSPLNHFSRPSRKIRRGATNPGIPEGQPRGLFNPRHLSQVAQRGHEQGLPSPYLPGSTVDLCYRLGAHLAEVGRPAPEVVTRDRTADPSMALLFADGDAYRVKLSRRQPPRFEHLPRPELD